MENIGVKSFTEQELLNNWVAIGKSNAWIRYADDPYFNEKSLFKCESIEQLKQEIQKGNWCLGAGFYYNNLCFINQVDGGDEWLTIKDDLRFESITFARIIKGGGFESLINRLLEASLEDCKNLNY